MAHTDRSNRSPLGDLVRIGIGVVLAAAAAVSTLEAHKRGIRADRRPGTRSFNQFLRQRTTPRRKPPETGLIAPVVPPRGPLPLQGGAAAPVDYEG